MALFKTWIKEYLRQENRAEVLSVLDMVINDCDITVMDARPHVLVFYKTPTQKSNSLMLFCLYHGVVKRNIYAVNIYISEAAVNIFFVRPLLIALWFHYDRMFILFFESIQIPFECYLLLKLITLRRKLIEHNQIPFACHAVSDVQVAVYDAEQKN